MSAEIPESHLFEHEAMNTTFSIRICEPDLKVAGVMAQQCFDELDLLEGKLSRFIDDSDISRINVMSEGESLYVTEQTHACLLLALDYYAKTRGLFDITLGRAIEHRKEKAEGPPPAIEGSLIIHPDRPAVTCQTPGRELDLGGIGKGFALDQLKQKLIEWNAQSALIAAGASTQLAFGDQTWPVEIIGEQSRQTIPLRNAALSASGTGIQGSHIIHPDGDEQELPWKHVWLTTRTAVSADVWSTALMLIGDTEVLQVPEIAEEIDSLFIEDESGISEVARPSL
ncbi:FAD:protein FMN transferase [Haloferula sp.]|uniref:FAD:protein FMN transferase n=1 Tax=Haloferula sp. TaxID=2497595 RepID=UPI00329A8E0A